MNKKEITEARQHLLSLEIARVGLTPLAGIAGKPARQIKDMATGRKSFGDGVAKEIGPKIRPDLPKEWLVYPLEHLDCTEGDFRKVEDPALAAEKPANLFLIEQPSPRDRRIQEIRDVLARTDETGLAVILHEAKKIADQYPIAAQETGS